MNDKMKAIIVEVIRACVIIAAAILGVKIF